MRKLLVVLAALVALTLTGVAVAALQPGVYDPGRTGCASSSIDALRILHLAKTCPTPTNAAAYAVITGQNGHRLTQLSFEFRGYCGAGSPRFNVNVYPSHVTYFYGCLYGVHTPLADNWTRVEYTGTEPGGVGGFGQIIDSIALLQDEEGSVELRHVTVNGVVQ